MRFTLATVAEATGGAVLGDPEIEVLGASIDSRSLEPQMLFVPVVAERDGHDFIEPAMAAGAAAHLTVHRGSDHPAVRVEDTTRALQALGAAARQRVHGPVVAITGSVGKTTTKDLLGAVLETTLRSHVSHRSFNNELGVPLTLVQAPDETDVVVVEMGARGAGHIGALCTIAAPDIGIVTAVAEAHTELFGSIDDIARAKGELAEALPSTGTAVLNADDQRVAAMAARTTARVITFGSFGDVRAESVELDPDLRARFVLATPWGHVPLRLAAAGLHTVSNALAAAAAGLVLGVDLEAIAEGLATAAVSPWRMEIGRTPSGALVLNDAYNANPLSMNAAFDALLSAPATTRIAVLGAMAELGDLTQGAHLAVGRRAAETGVSVVSIGVDAYGGTVVESAAAAIDLLGQRRPLGAEVAVLVKGSRVAGLETVAHWLLREA